MNLHCAFRVRFGAPRFVAAPLRGFVLNLHAERGRVRRPINGLPAPTGIAMPSPRVNYPLRLPETLMAEARALAQAEGVSINQFLSTLIAERVGELKALRHVRERITRGDPARAAEILARIPDRDPLPGDEL